MVETCRSSGEFTGMMQTKRWIRGKEKSYKRTISSSSTQMKQDKEQENKYSRHRLRPRKELLMVILLIHSGIVVVQLFVLIGSWCEQANLRDNTKHVH